MPPMDSSSASKFLSAAVAMPPMDSSSTSKKFLSTAASAAATLMLVRTITQDFLPEEVEDYIHDTLRTVWARITNEFTMVIEEKEGIASNNEIFAGADIYLGSRVPSSSSRRLKVHKPEKENIVVRIDEGEEVIDEFNGAVFRWRLMYKRLLNERRASSTVKHAPPSYMKMYSLSFNMKHKDMVFHKYLPHILEESKSIKQETKTLKIWTMDLDGVWGDGTEKWSKMQLDHPSNFETLAMDSKLKKTIMKDLDRFISRRDFYRRVGRAWKRGYLLYGPPGTGKSSLIAAMANYLNFDIYDVELSELDYNTELRSLLLATANRSILVFEDIDCNVVVQDRNEPKPTTVKVEKKEITLSGLLNFIDGLWSCAGDERIIIFTTNHKDKLDPALLRPGRMDMHIHMSYCTPCAFKTLAKSYLMIEEHHLFEEIEGCIVKAEVTPAEVAGELMKDDDPDIVLSGLVEFLHKKIIEHDQAKEKLLKKLLKKQIEKLKKLLKKQIEKLKKLLKNLKKQIEKQKKLLKKQIEKLKKLLLQKLKKQIEKQKKLLLKKLKKQVEKQKKLLKKQIEKLKKLLLQKLKKQIEKQ